MLREKAKKTNRCHQLFNTPISEQSSLLSGQLRGREIGGRANRLLEPSLSPFLSLLLCSLFFHHSTSWRTPPASEEMVAARRACAVVGMIVLAAACCGSFSSAEEEEMRWKPKKRMSGILIPGFASTQLRAWSILDCPYSPLDFNPLDLVWLDTTKVQFPLRLTLPFPLVFSLFRCFFRIDTFSCSFALRAAAVVHQRSLGGLVDVLVFHSQNLEPISDCST